MPRQLDPGEHCLTGAWITARGRVVADDTAKRIDWLVRGQLERVAVDPTGWCTLFRDGRDGRLWEMSYPNGEMHGGGPPRLEVISPADAKARYGDRTA